jgi:hypothetical protein
MPAGDRLGRQSKVRVMTDYVRVDNDALLTMFSTFFGPCPWCHLPDGKEEMHQSKILSDDRAQTHVPCLDVGGR